MQGDLPALKVTQANEQERAQVADLAKQVQKASDYPVEIAFVELGYTGGAAVEAAKKLIKLKVVKHTEAKRGFEMLPRRWSRSLLLRSALYDR